jgi:hypothetical protein
MRRYKLTYLVPVIIIGLGILSGVGLVARTRYIPLFDRLTPLYEEELTDAVDDYLQIIDLRATEKCPERAVGRSLQDCIEAQYHTDMGDIRYVQQLRVTTYTSDCAIVIVVYHTMGSIANVVYRLVLEDGVWKVAERTSGFIEDERGREQGLITMANPPLLFSCSEE